MNKEEILAICLEEISSGRSSLEECLKRYPELAGELRPLLHIALSLKPEDVQASAEFKQRARRRIFEEMQVSAPVRSRSTWGWPRLAAFRALALVVLSLLVVGVAGGGTVFAAQGSLPGDTLYGVKTGFENFQLAITPGSEGKANLHLEIAQKRVDEAARLIELQRPIDSEALATVSLELDAALKEIGANKNRQEADESLQRFTAATLNQQLAVQQALSLAPPASQDGLKQALDATRRGNLISQIARSNHEFLQSTPSVSDEKIDGGKFSIDGTLTAIAGQDWIVGEVTIKDVHYSGQLPPIGSHVQIEGIVKEGRAYISQLKVLTSANNQTRVQGQLGKTNPDGTTDVGGIPVTLGNDIASQIKPGDNVQLQAGAEKGKLDVTAKKTKDELASSGASLTGTLTEVNGAKTTISARSSGSLIEVNVAQASIRTEGGKTIKFSDLKSYIGKEISLDGLYKNGNVVFAGSLILKTGD